MPINDKTLGKYIRPAIYIEEVDKSQYVEPPIQEVLTNLVPGFSRKGPYNKPIKVNNANEFINIFGSIDRNLENKGSYFHKTVLNMLERGPVWALNLLKTDPNRDKVNWKSISLSAKYDNAETKTAPYERLFDRQDFWELSMSELLDIVTDDNGGVEVTDKLLHITNIQDKNITVFMYKSSVTGFDVTAEFWYGGRENVPRYINYSDWISDYIVSVLVIAGNWSNYVELSADPYWSRYFTSKGIKKDQIQNFVNDKNITALAYYDASLIPKFKDINGKDMYIVDIINNDTNKTGLFCTYNEDALLSTDSYMGRIDLLGQTLVGTDKKSINFISYNDTITETKQYDIKYLDTVGNVFGNFDDFTGHTGNYSTGKYRSSLWTNWLVSGITDQDVWSGFTDTFTCTDTGITTATITDFNVGDVIYFTKSWGPILSAHAYYIIYESGNNYKISTTKDGSPITGLNTIDFDSTSLVYTGYYEFDINTSGFYNIGAYQYTLSAMTDKAYIKPFTISNTGLTYSKYDLFYLSSDNTYIQTLSGSQIIGTTPSKPNFILYIPSTIILGYVKTTYTAGVITLDWTDEVIGSDGYNKIDLVITSGTTSGNNYIDITFPNSHGSYSDLTNYKRLRERMVYDELTYALQQQKAVIINKTNGTKYPIIDPTFMYYYINRQGMIRIYVDTPSNYYNTDGEILIYYIDNEFILSGVGNTTTTGITYTQLDYINTSGRTMGRYSSLYQDFYNGYVNNYDYFYVNNDSGTTQRVFLKFVMEDATPVDDLIVSFLTQYTPTEVQYSMNTTLYNSGITIYSDKSNWRQTVDVVNSGITDLTNTRVIYVDKVRYSEIKRGDFLEAYYDTSYYDSPGEGYVLGYEPKKFTRIYNISNSPDGIHKILYTDAPIKLHTYSTNVYYTNIYPSIDTYFSEYKGIYLQAFNVSNESIPDGTDARLSTILSVINKDTKLAQGLSNKNRISWRYLVDSFGLGLTSNSKQEYVDLCGRKLNCLGFINMPSVKQLKKSVNPSFIDTDNTLNTTLLKKGGDDTMNPDFLYSFGTGVGESCVGYFFPYVKDSDDINRFYPPASYAARTYMNKFISSTVGIQPWTTVAGAVYGIIPDIYETEMNFSEQNLDDLYQMNANPITYIMNRGYIINSENTAQVWPQSMLSLIHTRETLIELENRIYDMLLNYQWRFNNQESRSEIKYRADQICKELKEAGALYDYKNVIDSTNNTETIIDAKMGVLDTFVEIEKGMGIIVNQITILRKGVIESGGFATV